MKTRFVLLRNAAVRYLFMVTLIAVVACQGRKGNSDNGTATSARAPAIPIHEAVLTNNLEALKQHISAGSDLNQKDPYGGSSPLITAAVFDKPDAAKLLIDAGADINFQNNDGSTALHTAAFFCRPGIVKMLLEKGADKTIRNKFGATPFETVASPFADAKASYEMMEKLLGPMGLKLDFSYTEKTRPEIAATLK